MNKTKPSMEGGMQPFGVSPIRDRSVGTFCRGERGENELRARELAPEGGGNTEARLRHGD